MMNINPKQLEKAMKQMGLAQETIEATEVVIKTSSGEIRISNPSVTKMTMQGNESFQVTGDVSESSVSEDDVNLVVEQTGKSVEEARAAIEETGGIAEAIVKLSE